MNFSILKSKMFMSMLTVLFSVTFVSGVFAQSGTSTVRGNVSDQTGAAVPGATVTITNPATKFTRSVTTSSDGSYSFPGLAPSTYRLEVSASGFKKAVNSNVQALVDSTASFDIVLETGDITATVDVTTNNIESVINTQDASIGNNFVPQQITQLPTSLRRVNDLLSLQPGVTRDGYVAGGRSDQANITLDGIDINDQQTGGRTAQFQTSQGSALRATTESVEEFRITTINANANQGRSSGAQISLVTRRGSNNWNGAGFYFYRPTAYSANDFFSNAAGSYEATDQAVIDGLAKAGDPRAPRPSLARDIFGGRLGGPIIQDRLFFFYSYEGQRQTLGEPVTRTVPLAHLGMGQLRFPGSGPSCTGGNCSLNLAELNSIYSVVGINPAAVAALAGAASRYPANSTSAGDQINTSGFRWNAPTTIKENTHIARFDLKVNDSQDMFARFNYQWDNQAGGAALQAFPDTPAGGVWSHPIGFVVGHNWTINSNMINNFRYGLTRQSFSVQGDSSENFTNFRFVFTPFLYNRTLNRTTPVTNITDDFTWIKGNQTLQFGGNVRIIRNRRTDFGSAFDVATANPSFYNLSGAVVSNEIADAGYTIGDIATAQAGATALIGRFSQYSGNFTFDLDGSVLAAGTPSNRNFATEEYEAYIQDIWKPFRNLTITGGLRYSLSRPVYEQNGFQVVPSVPLGDLFDRRVAGMRQGVPVNDLVTFVKGGPANNGPGFYPMDKNNLQPRIAAAWSPSFSGGFWKALFGEEGDSTIRGGFAMTNDYFGSQLAVSFDGLSAIGFTSNVGINANTYDVTTNPAPLFTAFGQDVRSLPGIPPPTQVFSAPADEQTRIQTSLDANIVSPTHYTWNVSYGRSLPKGAYFEMNYIGRQAENLFASRDVFALNNLVDPQSGMDWYTAAGMLVDARNAGIATSALGDIPYFQNLFPNANEALSVFGLGGFTDTQAVYALINSFGILDYTFVQLIIDDATEFGLPVDPGLYPNMFFHPQYAALTSFGTTARSLYHGGNFSLRQRLGQTLSYDVNYTFSKSMDNASGLQTGGSYGSQFILNPLRPEDNYSVSDFDTKHVVNANFIFQLPLGRGKAYFSDMNAFADAIVGGWQLAGVYRWNSGQPVPSPFDGQVWATNWNVQSSGVRIRPLETTENRDNRNIFANPLAALNSFRNARPGETGDRNVLRGVPYSNLDLGLSKYFTMPWSETHKLQFRWEVFNVMNTQPFSAGAFTRASWGLGEDPNLATSANDFGNVYNAIQGSPRSMQFGLRYEF